MLMAESLACDENARTMEWKLICVPHDICSGLEFRTIDELAASGFEILDAQVPGNFELDLMDSGKLPDLYYSVNTLQAQKLEDMHLWYLAEFVAERDTDYLLFEGIDTYSDIYINGQHVISTDNMFLPYEVKENITAGKNEVVVHIRPAMLEARKYVSPAASNALSYNYASLYTRKAAHMYGWDIMPRIVSAGLWKRVRVMSAKPDRLNEVYLVTNKVDIGKETADMSFYMNADLQGSLSTEYRVRVEGRCGNSCFREERGLWHNTHFFRFSLKGCKFWWPKNAGKQNIYDVKVTLLHGDEPCDTYVFRTGIRTIALERTDSTDSEGKGEFCFRVNGERVFVLGTNWVPLNAFHSQDEKRLVKALELLDDIGCNMVRCWGGNVYEPDAFYSFCDEKGILVWQDFAMGCAVYPEDAEFADRLYKEAVYQIKRLRNHVSLALWAGDNEGDCSYESWNGFRRDPNQNILTRQILRHAVSMHDYARPYLPSSPYISESVYKGEGILPENHLWGPRDYFKGEFYKSTFTHFASETGYHGFNSPISLKRFLKHPEAIFDHDGNPTDEYLVHAACMELDRKSAYAYRIRLAYDQVVTLFGEARESLEEFTCQSQISQAEAKKYFIEKFRIGKWKRTGIIWWNLLDGWPQVSDAVVDYYFVKKLAYNYIKRSQQPVCLMFDEPVDGRISLVGVNDLKQDKTLNYRVMRVSGEDDSKETVLMGSAVLEADSSCVINSLEIRPDEQEFYLIEWEYGNTVGRNHYYTNLLNISYERYLRALKACGMDEFEGYDENNRD